MEQDSLNRNRGAHADEWVDRELAALDTQSEWQPDMHRGLALLRQRQGKPAGQGRRWVWAAGAALATGVTLMAAPATRNFAHRCLAACAIESGWVRELLLDHGAGANASTVLLKLSDRRPAPDFHLTGPAGEQISLSQFRGRAMLVNFWATWCAPCRQEIPMLEEFQRAYGNRGFVVLGLALDDGGWSVVRPFAEAARINYPVMIADSKTTDLFGGLKAVPMTFVIDKEGRVAAVHAGLCQKSECEGDIQAVLNEAMSE
jgi:thiol-disulfide isomerase/thioredoxin